MPLRAAKAVCAITAPLTVALLLLGHGAAPWIELLFRLCTDGVVLLLWVLASLGIGSVVAYSLLPRSLLDDIKPATARAQVSALPGGSGPDDRVLRIVAAVAAGMGVLSLLVLLLGLVGGLTTTTAWLLVVAGLLLTPAPGVRRVLAPWRQRPSNPRIDATLFLLAPVGAMLLVAALTPPGVLWQDEPHPYDVLSYHLQLPREWLELGRIRPLQHNVFSYFPLNVEMHYLLAMHLRGGVYSGMYLAQLMHASMTLLLPLAIYGALRPRGRTVASAGAVLVGTSPWLLLLGGVAYNEAGLLLFATLATIFAIRSMGDAGSRGEVVLAGLFAGFACGTKLTAVPTVLLALPLAMAATKIAVLRPRPGAAGHGASRPLRGEVVAFLLAGLLSFAPWLVRNVAWTGNPVFPEMTAWFGRAHFSPEQVDRWQAAHSPRNDQRSIAARLEALVKHSTLDWRGAHVLGGLLVVGIVVGFARRTRESVMLATLLLLLLAFWLGLSHLQGRFLVLGIPLAAIMLGSLPVLWSCGGALVGCASLVLGIVHAGPQLARSAVVLGLSDLTPLLRASLPDKRSVDRMIESDRPLTLVGDARAFLYAVPMSRLRYRTVFDVAGQDLRDAYGDPGSGPGLILVDPGELRRLLATYRHFPSQPEAWLTLPGTVLRDN